MGGQVQLLRGWARLVDEHTARFIAEHSAAAIEWLVDAEMVVVIQSTEIRRAVDD